MHGDVNGAEDRKHFPDAARVQRED
jgi:hypothetical protein